MFKKIAVVTAAAAVSVGLAAAPPSAAPANPGTACVRAGTGR